MIAINLATYYKKLKMTMMKKKKMKYNVTEEHK